MGFWESTTKLVSDLAWPVMVLLLVRGARDQLGRLFDAVIERVRDKNQEFSVGKDGVSFKAIAAEVASLKVGQQQLTGMVIQAETQAFKAVPHEGAEIPDKLRHLADEYKAVDIPDYRLRVSRKNEIVQEMVSLVLRQHVSKDALAREQSKGLIVALAGAVHTLPEAGDLARLLKVAPFARWLHVRYRLALAFGQLIERGMVPDEQVPAVNDALNKFREGADRPLEDLVDQLKSQLDRL